MTAVVDDGAADASAVWTRGATMDDVATLAALFDAYRQFYDQPSDLGGARRFLSDRIATGESHVIIASVEDEGRGAPVGFVQLYPTFSSVWLSPAIVLNDLWVAPRARKRGVARSLMHAAHAYAITRGASQVYLSTASDNRAARALYESEGYVRDVGFEHYTKVLPSSPPDSGP